MSKQPNRHIQNKWTAVLMLLITSACVPSVEQYPLATHPPDPVQSYVDANRSQSTAVAAVATADFFAGQLTATLEAQHATATERAWLISATERAEQVAATERAWNATTTADSIIATSTAESTATALALEGIATQHAFNITATTDSASASAFATAQAGEATMIELEIQRKTMMNKVWAASPAGILFTLFVTGLVLLFRWNRVRLVQRDPRGDAPLMIVDGKIYDADRNPFALLDISGAEPKIPALVDSRLQSQTTTRDQMIDLATRGALQAPTQAHRKEIASNMAKEEIAEMPEIILLPPDGAKPWAKDVLPQIVHDAIEADVFIEPERSE